MPFTECLYFTDFLNELLKSRKKRTEAFKAGKTKGRINNFDLSDDQDKQGRTKRVSFLKSQRNKSPSEDTTESEMLSEHHNYRDSVSSQHSTNINENNTQLKNSDLGSMDPQLTSESFSKSMSNQVSDDTLTGMSLPLPSDSSVIETPGPEFPQPSASKLEHMSSAGLFTSLLYAGHSGHSTG